MARLRRPGRRLCNCGSRRYSRWRSRSDTAGGWRCGGARHTLPDRFDIEELHRPCDHAAGPIRRRRTRCRCGHLSSRLQRASIGVDFASPIAQPHERIFDRARQSPPRGGGFPQTGARRICNPRRAVEAGLRSGRAMGIFQRELPDTGRGGRGGERRGLCRIHQGSYSRPARHGRQFRRRRPETTPGCRRRSSPLVRGQATL